MVSYLDQGGVQHLVDKIRDLIYPVNSLYISTSATSPASYFGGTWERYGTGRALISASDTDNDFKAGTTGGSKTTVLKHRLAQVQGLAVLATDNADPSYASHTGFVVNNKNYGYEFLSDSNIRSDRGANRDYGDHRPWIHEATVPIPTLEPYVAVYIWRRTA